MSKTEANGARRLTKTSTPGIFKRGDRFVVVYRDRWGKQRKAFASTLAQARDVKAQRTLNRAKGEESRALFADYARAWLKTYAGRTARGLREETRADYERALERHAIPFL